MKYLVFDTETTGLPFTKIMNKDTLDLWPHIVQFSFVIFDDMLDKIVTQVDHIVKLDTAMDIPQESTHIHGITKEISMNKGIPIMDILWEFFYYIRQPYTIVIGHNVQFDVNMVHVELLRILYAKVNIHIIQIKKVFENNLKYLLANKDAFVCTMKRTITLCNITKLNRHGYPYVKFPKLIELHNILFHSKPANLHNSLIDVLIALRCYMKLEFDVDIIDICDEIKNTTYLSY